MLRKRGKIAIWGTAVLLAAGVVVTALSEIHQIEARAVEGLDAQGRQVLAGSEASLNRHLLVIDLLLFNLPQQLASSLNNDGSLNADKASQSLGLAQAGSGVIKDLMLVGLNGELRATARGTSASAGMGPRLPQDLLERMRRRTPGEPIVAAPWVDPRTAEQKLLLARTVQLGSVDHVAVASIAHEQLARILLPSAMTQAMTLTLEDPDNRLLAAAPATAGVPGRLLSRFDLSAAGLDGRMVKGMARLTDEPALVGARPLLYAGLRIVLSEPLQDVLAPLGRSTQPVGWAALSFVAIILIAAGLIHWQFDGQLRSTAEVARNRATLNRALGAMSDGFLLCDENDHVSAWNERYLEMHPWLGQVIGKGVPFSTLLWHASIHALPETATDEDRAAWRELRMRQHQDGDADFALETVNSAVLHISERRIPDGGVVGIYRDVTLSERKLQRAKAEAESANAAKTRFLATMSHEIRTPLNGVLGINSLLEHTQLTDEQRTYVKTIEASGRTLLALLNDILDVSRIEAGKIELECIAFDLKALVTDVTDTLTPQASAKGLTMACRLPTGPLPLLLGDPHRLRQILFNLIGNALKFTHIGRIGLDVDLSPVGPGRSEVQLTISDTGIGMHESVVQRLFDRFAQADSSTVREYGGSGLGLSICRDLVQLMNGRIAVTSTPGRGSVFTVHVELAHASPAPTVVSTPSLPAERSLNILVAEDNEVNRLVVRTLLQYMGHRCELASDGAQAVSLASRGGWDCVLMDIHMPGMDGILATQMIRGLGGPASRVPIIALTADAMPEERRRSLAAGMEDHLTKPLTREALDVALRRISHRLPAEA